MIDPKDIEGSVNWAWNQLKAGHEVWVRYYPDKEDLEARSGLLSERCPYRSYKKLMRQGELVHLSWMTGNNSKLSVFDAIMSMIGVHSEAYRLGFGWKANPAHEYAMFKTRRKIIEEEDREAFEKLVGLDKTYEIDQLKTAFGKDCHRTVLHAVAKARTSILLAMYRLSNVALLQELINAGQRGVRIDIVVDSGTVTPAVPDIFFNMGETYPSWVAEICSTNGTVHVYDCIAPPGKQRLMHNKFAVFDSETVVTGSYNWTQTLHFENVVLIKSKVAGQEFTAAFEEIKSEAQPWQDICVAVEDVINESPSVYHQQDCAQVSSLQSNSGILRFANEHVAKIAGFKPCSICCLISPRKRIGDKNREE